MKFSGPCIGGVEVQPGDKTLAWKEENEIEVEHCGNYHGIRW